MMKSNPKAKKPNILLRVLAFLVTAALVLGAAALVAWRDELNLDAFRRWLSYRSIQTSDTGLQTRLEAFYDMISMRKEAHK